MSYDRTPAEMSMDDAVHRLYVLRSNPETPSTELRRAERDVTKAKRAVRRVRDRERR